VLGAGAGAGAGEAGAAAFSTTVTRATTPVFTPDSVVAQSCDPSFV
jgi:hypothetical protein